MFREDKEVEARMNELLFQYYRGRGVRDAFILSNHEVGFAYLRWVLESKGFRVQMVTPHNRGRHLLIKTIKDGEEKYFYALFKKDTFHSFNYEFKDFVKENPEFCGQAESINVEYLQLAINRNALLVFVYENGGIYLAYPKGIKAFCDKHKLIREQRKDNPYKTTNYDGLKVIINEKTYSFPLILLRNIDELK